MNVQYAVRKLLHEPGREQAHVPCHADEIDLSLLQELYNLAVVLLAGLAFGRDYSGFQTQSPRGFDPCGISAIGDHDCDPGIPDNSRGDVVCNRLEVGAPSGEKYSEVFHSYST